MTEQILKRLALLACLALAACSSVPMTRHPRAALDIPENLATRYAIPGPIEERTLIPIGSEDSMRYHRGQLAAGHEVAEFYFIDPPRPGPRPFVLLLPILAGGRELMWFIGTDLASRGYAVAWPRRVSSALQREQRGPELEELFRRSVVHARMVLAWARTQPELDAERTGLVGISLGSMIGSAVMAVEPGLRAGALCLAGGDLPEMLMVSAEPRARRWLRWRAADDGIASLELQRELDQCIVSDPALLAGYVDTDRVLLVSASLDDVVPPRNQDLLWESLGRPKRVWLPLGHYSAALAIHSVLGEIDTFFVDRGCRRLGHARP